MDSKQIMKSENSDQVIKKPKRTTTIDGKKYRLYNTADKPYSIREQMAMTKESVFNIIKLRDFLEKLIETNSQKKAWQGEKLSKFELGVYACKVLTLLEEIRQVDMQLLAVNRYSYAENVPSGQGVQLSEKEKLAFESFLNTQNKQSNEKYKTQEKRKRDYLEHQSKYKELCLSKLFYLVEIGTLTEKKIQDPESTNEAKEAAKRYLKRLNKQIRLLIKIFDGDIKGFDFDIDTLLFESDEIAKMYMAIVAPDKFGKHKDVFYENDKRGAKLIMPGSNQKDQNKTMYFGIGTPIRTFAWMLKYIMDSTARAGNPPLVRVLDISQETLDKINSDVLSENYKFDSGGKQDKKPVNVDIKLPNQYGIPKEWEGFGELLQKSHLNTIAEPELMPKAITHGSGSFMSIAELKDFIGFRKIIKNKKILIPDVHFLNRGATAFTETDTKGKTQLHTAARMKELHTDTFGRMLALRMFLEGIIQTECIPGKLLNWVTEVLEANHCMPPKRKYDLHGNLQVALDNEKMFAGNKIGQASSEDVEFLIDIVSARFDEKLKGKNRSLYNLACSLTTDSGFMYELQYLFGSDASFFESPKELRSKKNMVFSTLKKKSDSNNAYKYHIMAFCFKMLRLMQQNSKKKPEDSDFKNMEETLFSKRVDGDHFNAINRMRHKTLCIGKNDVEIPYDKMMSTDRYRPEGGEAKKSFIPFVGGVSGTTRDISLDLMSKELLLDEEKYWKFQLSNAAFMILNNYHSFMEVIFSAAAARIEFAKANPDVKNFDEISQRIMDYLRKNNTEWKDDDPVLNENIRKDIISIISKTPKPCHS